MKLRPRAEVITFKQNRVLCAYHKDKGYVIFPGGGIDPQESALDAAKRETFEEAGRKLVHPSVAHAPTTQIWPKGYAEKKGNKWANGYEGGYTFWMTGSVADLPLPPSERHKDFETGMDWRPVKEVIQRLKEDMGGDWNDDAKIRMKILETHLQMQQKHKEAAPVSLLFVSRPRSVLTGVLR